MKQPTLKSQLLQYLFKLAPHWVHKGQLENIKWKNQKNFSYYLPSNVASELRKMEQASKIAVRDDKNRKSIEYRYLNEEERDTYIPQHEKKKFMNSK